MEDQVMEDQVMEDVRPTVEDVRPVTEEKIFGTDVIVSDIETIYMDRDTISATNYIQRLFKNYGIKKILDIIEPIYLVYNADEFFNEKEKLEIYIKSLNKIFAYHKQLTNILFVEFERFPVISANGQIYIIRVNKSSINTPLLLVKEPLRSESDPISYEYYIGLTLNQLRLNHNIPSFPIVFGKIHINNKNLILYEYVRDKNRTKLSLYKYIKSELKDIIDEFNNSPNQKLQPRTEYRLKKLQLNILYMLIFLLLTLQIAQDVYNFTHYDLHLNNILLVKLNRTYKFNIRYHNYNFVIFLDYMPYIIDYGRSHIKPQLVFSYEDYFLDDRNNRYDSFYDYQNFLWDNKNYAITKKSTLDKINDFINKIREQLSYLPDNETILNQYYYLIPGTKDIYYFRPDIFNSKYDFYKLTRAIASIFVSNAKQLPLLPISPFWNTIDRLLSSSYPFYIPNTFNLPKSYHSLTNRFNTCIELVLYIYNQITTTEENEIEETESDIIPFSINQIAGAKIKTEKFKSDVLYKPYEPMTKKGKKSLIAENNNTEYTIIKSVKYINKSEKLVLYNKLYKKLNTNIEDVSNLLHDIDDYSKTEHFSPIPGEY